MTKRIDCIGMHNILYYAPIAEKGWHIADTALIHDTSSIEEDQVIKTVENLRRRLMNSKQDTCACIRHLFQYLAKLYG